MSPRLHPDLTTADTEYGTVLLDQRDGRYWQLNPSAALIMRVLTEGGDRDRAADTLLDAFDVDRDRALHDVDAVLTELTAAGLVVP
ncbi:lasso peptide biosynthesis PqqD family chaperone [Actinoplanes flavus]|uniref:Lasso peptide biosynthesis PqqD family chaperone n=1 Tax=Actinoplanes flavus TaxID=2820290 RepID=A0ABS3UF81_9ACTN|nr:lasso peptide biosynthesis PqqD family chaperone [Actinoplanes flavus]MBO3737425.1 lasso peptide biosynthesis PqqD family chaperone [Actinoplanes flavus]